MTKRRVFHLPALLNLVSQPVYDHLNLLYVEVLKNFEFIFKTK